MTNAFSRIRRMTLGAIVVLAIAAEPLLACSVCFGDPNSAMVKGTQAGILVMLVVVYGVVFTMVGIAGCWFIRARRLAGTEPDAS